MVFGSNRMNYKVAGAFLLRFTFNTTIHCFLPVLVLVFF